MSIDFKKMREERIREAALANPSSGLEAQKKLRPEPLPCTFEELDVECTSCGSSGSWQEPAEPPMGRMVCTEITFMLTEVEAFDADIEVGKDVECAAQCTYGDIDQEVEFTFSVELMEIRKGVLHLYGKGASEDFQTGPTPMQSQKGCL